ncbi:uncharacterized protein DUF3151 [Barrientosiimonas humi]|uniref:Uncharacterized protein DUF3151 n=1 Tax=Barrientosiimonas humi TaxID=999931 RepID=A0A542XFA1_9MICO|nr:DUF3151 domain-containing protein [Barrientosiimonas humi]TQL34499.1 uncharacterized protein DUF3151 [Barrientosiimonas humi]CAG7574488.1 hypothetical protein BH39T_PBIAJDOK_03144 [Barrientosiimonas humi]
MDQNLLGIPPTELPEDPAAAALAEGRDPRAVAAAAPTSSLAWAQLAEDALADGLTIEAYAFARTGYHRGLDALRRAGWKGQGPVPWEHEPNRGFLRALAVLSKAAGEIGETDEQQRCADFLRSSSATAARELGID